MIMTLTLVMLDTLSNYALSFCEVQLNSLYQFSVTADTRLVSDKPMYFNCDLNLGCGNINFV